MSKPPKPFKMGNSRKRKFSKVTSSETKNITENQPPEDSLQKLNPEIPQEVPKKKKKSKSKKKKVISLSEEEIGNKFPVLKDKELQEKFLKVTLTNNQKGRIRQNLRDIFKGISDELLPEIINNKIQLMLKSDVNLNDSDLRKVRILFNMLKTATEKKGEETSEETKPLAATEKRGEETSDDAKPLTATEDNEVKSEVKAEKPPKVKKEKSGESKDNEATKVKGPKRYVVFIGNLPIDIDKEKIMAHFSDLSNHIQDLRLPKLAEGKKVAIAYLELKDEPSYELALSKHHSMLANKRINVLYSTQQGSKITKTEAKSKSAKLIALQKSGQLLGSVPLSRKRSQRRKKMKLAKAKEEAERAI